MKNTLDSIDNMMLHQLKANDIHDETVLIAMKKTPREPFLDVKHHHLAYADMTITQKDGSFLLSPVAQARLLSCTEIDFEDNALVFDFSNGYVGALLSFFTQSLTIIFPQKETLKDAEKIYKNLKIDHVNLVQGFLEEGAPEHAPYETLLINAAIDDFPEALCEQVTENGKRIFVKQSVPCEIICDIKKGKLFTPKVRTPIFNIQKVNVNRKKSFNF